MKKVRPVENTRYDCLINYITKTVRNSLGGFRDKIVSLFETTHLNKLFRGEDRN